MHIERNKSLKNYNTFGIEAIALNFVSVSTIDQLKEILQNSSFPERFILGGGSNILLTKEIDALVIHIHLKGITTVFEDENSIHIKAMAGENWHELVLYCLSKNYGGIENLSLIPGNVGTAPIQNIGAYGVELKDVFVSCEAISIENQSKKTFDLNDCEFDYRSSVFKAGEKGKYIITSVTLRLTKKNHILKTEYGSISEELEKMKINNPSIQDVSRAVIAIRQSKLPDPKEIGNSGSFFKNPVIDKAAFQKFYSKHPEAPFYKIDEDSYKIPAGWLIEQSGLKGKRFGNAGVHQKQALVLVNYGHATGKEILDLAYLVQKTVKENFDIAIEPEVNVV